MKFKIAVIGCGAIAETGHLPGSRYSELLDVSLLVDTNIQRANELAQKFNIAKVSDKLEDVPKFSDAAVVATPPGTHCKIACELMRTRIPVLLEKPIALSSSECHEMMRCAAENNVLIAAGMTRRLFRNDLLVRELVRKKILGNLIGFTVENGYNYEWPSSSNFIMNKSMAGGGVLMGLGSHVLDSLIWMLGDLTLCKYTSDAQGGIESECSLVLQTSNNSTGTVELSRSRNLSNKFVFRFEGGSLISPFYGDSLELQLDGYNLSLQGRSVPIASVDPPPQSIEHIMAAELEDFVNAISNKTDPMATIEDVTKSIQLIEQCYSTDDIFTFPWMQSNFGDAK